MLLVDQEAAPGTIEGTIQRLPEKPEAPGFFDALAPAFRTENTVGSARAREDGLPPFGARLDPNFDPFANLDGFEDHAPRFAFANSADEVEAIKRQIQREIADRQLLDSAGIAGVGASFVAGVVDPVNLIPVGGTAYKTYRGAQAGGRILEGAMVTARAGLLGTTAAEALLQSTQETRSWGDSAINIAAGTFLAGVLGSAASIIGELHPHVRAERAFADLAARVDRDLTVPADAKPDPLTPGFRKVSAAELEADTLGKAYDQVLAQPIGRADDPVVRLSPGDIEDVLVSRGPVIERDGEIVVQGRALQRETGSGRGFGLVKIIWRHGERSAKASADQVTRDDITALPDVIRQFEPVSVRGEPGQDGYAREWRVARGDRQVVYATTRFSGESQTVTIHADRNPDMPLSKERAAGSPATLVGRDGDTAAGAYNRDPQSRPEDSLAPDAPAVQTGPGTLAGGSVGAAAVRDTTLAEEGLKSALGLEKAIRFSDPLLRTATAPAIATRRTIQELAESPLSYEKNRQGIPTAPGGSVETRIKMWQAPLASALQTMDDAFVRYRLGRSKRFGDIARLGVGDMLRSGRAEGVLNYSQFKQEVSRAMRRGDQHPVTEVGEAARAWRGHVFDPLKDRAIELGMLPEDVGVETAASYLSRLYNIEKIAARRPEFVGIVTTWLTERQAKRQQLRADLEPLLDRDKLLAAAADKAESKMATQDRRATTASERLEEARRQLARDITRAMDLAERQAGEEAAGGKATRPKAQRVEISTAITALRERANVLHDRASGARAKADGLAAYLEDLQARHQATKADIEAIIEEWPGRADDARGILRTAVDYDDLELTDIAEQITDRILGTPDGRLPYDGSAVPEPRSLGGRSRPQARGPLKARSFLIPDERIEDFLENDIEAIGRIYTRTMAADTELTARFGDVAMTDQIDNIRREYADRSAAAASEAERKKLFEQRNADIRDIAAVRDRLRGAYALPRDPGSVISRGARVVKNLNYLRLLGGMTASALPDPFRIAMVHGLRRFVGDGLAPAIANLQGFKLAGREVKLAGGALDMVLDSRTMAIADVLDDYGRHSKFERSLHSAASNFGVVSLMAPWNAFWKQVAGTVTMTRMLEAAERVAGGAASARDLERLAASGIDAQTAERIWRQFEKHGGTANGLRLANTLQWDDAGAVTSFRAALLRDVDRIIVTPGQDKPLWMSTQLGGVIGQFKSFQMASTQRVLLAGLQDRDASTLAGLALMVGGGMAVYALKSWEAGKELSSDPVNWLIEGVDRSGVTGWFFEPHNMIEKATRGTIGLKSLLGSGRPMSRYASRNVTDALLGPTFGLVEDAIRVAGKATASSLDSDQNWTRADTRALRRLLPYQNLLGFRHAVDQLEQGINDNFGVPQK